MEAGRREAMARGGCELSWKSSKQRSSSAILSMRTWRRGTFLPLLEAQSDVLKNQAGFDPLFLKRQANKGVARKTALRRLKWARSQLVKAALEARARTEHWEHAVGYFRAVEKSASELLQCTPLGSR